MNESQSTQAAELRRRAEERLKGQPAGAVLPLPEADVQRLVYELQLHQMELELQGEELRTEQKRAEEALQESEARYRALFEESIDGVFITSPAGKILDISRAGIAMFGYDTKEELLRLDLATEIYADPDDRARVLSAVRERGAAEYEVEVKKKNGEILLTRCFNTVVRDSNGEIICYRGVIRDITQIRRQERERKQAEEALRQSEARFRQTLDNMLEGCMLIGFDWTYLYVNESAARHGHGKRENLIGRTMLEMYPGVQDTVIFAHYRRCMEERIPQRFEAPFTFLDGATDWFEFSVEPTPDGIFVLSLDISERRRAEAVLRESDKRLRELNALQGLLLPPHPIEQKLKLVTEAVVRIVGADFARIWMIKPGDRCEAGCIHAQIAEGPHTCRFRDRCLHLMASSGRYTHTDGRDHGRVPFGCYKIGKVAAGEEPKFLTNDVTNDPRVHNPAWAKELGLVSFAGYRLVDTGGTPLGVLALFSKQAISAEEDALLDGIAYATCQVLHSARAEAALRESEQKFRSFVEESSEGFTLADEQGTIIDCNRALEKMTGLSAKQVIGRALWDVQYEMLPPEVRTSERYERAKQVVLNALQTGQSPLFNNVIEIEMMKQDGNLQFIQQTVFPIRTDKGYRIGSVTRDITQRKRAEQKVNQLAAIVQSSEDAIIGKTLDGIITSWNRGAEKIYGYAESEVVGKPISILVLPDCEDEVPQILEKIKSGNHIEHYEAVRRRKDGREIQMSLTISPVRDAEGRIVAASTIGRDITERKRAEETLWQTNELLERVFANVDLMIACMDVDFNFIRVNRAYAEADHRAPEFFVGKNHFELYPNEENENIFRRVIQTGEPYFAYAKPFVYAEHPERGVTYWNWTLQPMKEVDGSIGGLVLSLLNVTERERAARELQAASLYARSLIEVSLDPLVTISPEGKITDVNQATELVTGVSREQLIGSDFSDYFTEPERARAGYREVFREGSVRDYPLEIQHRDGHVTPVLYNASVYRDEGGSVVGVFAAARDITERKRMEAEREQLLAQIQAQARQIAQIIDTVPEGVLLLDATGRVLLANPIAGRDLITLAQAQVGDRLTCLGDRPLAELLTSPPKGLWHEVQADRRSFEVIARPIANGAEPEHWVLVINDVTQAHAVREQLQQQERLAAVGQLAAGIAHDFNNILAIIALHTPLVARASGLTERDRERLAIISEQTGHATRLIQQILDFSRRAVLERRPLDLGPLLKEQVKLLARTLPETIAVTLAAEPGEYVVLADPTRLQQMLMNLAVNARDAMPAGGALRLALARQEVAPRPDLPAGPWIRLTVADNGRGIAPEALAHLFEPFFTTKPHGQGTGLGLAQVHGIVKQHEGEIEVHSAVGQGATFTIYLPAVAEAAVAPALPAAAAAGGAEQMILIVEDNAVLLDALSDIVETLGYRVVGAGNGVEALTVLETRGDAIALVLSDLMMPVMGGEALFRAMRGRGLSVPVVMLSGHPLEGELDRLKALGLAGWLLKPPAPDDLARLLAQALADRRA